jgi:activator of HSP90 ATPase
MQKKHSEFTGSKAACTLKAGGSFSAWGGYITGRNVALEAGKKIVQEWQTTEWAEGYGPSVLEITLEENKGAAAVSQS